MIRQYGVLPYRMTSDGSLSLLLVTSRDTGRWVLPRGNLVAGLSPPLSAAREAFEEAGVVGALLDRPTGSYRYKKRRRSGRLVDAEVTLYPLKVAELKPDWPERGQRELRWFSPEEAAAAVDEPGLKSIILAFAPDAPPQPLAEQSPRGWLGLFRNRAS